MCIVYFTLNLCVSFCCCSSEKRQTVLFSATQTRNVEDLARISLRKAPLYVGVDDHKDTSTVEGLEQVGVGGAGAGGGGWGWSRWGWEGLELGTHEGKSFG